MPVMVSSVRFPDRYQDVRLIAQGGMGSVYCANDTILRRMVAIKVLDERFTGDPTVRKRFTREALAAARLSSDPNTITIFDVGECDGRPFIVMEYLHGGSLEDVLKGEGAQPPSRVVAWLDETAQALDHAHEQNVVHRDVKPGNLLLTADSHIRVADFGVASAAGLESFTLTGTVIGTAGYLSPEQAEGNPATPASDRYSLGVVSFELLVGSRPFERDTPAAEAAAHVHVPPPAISTESPQIPGEVDGVFARALAKDPDHRFSTCGEFVQALRAAFATAAGPTRILRPAGPSSSSTNDTAPATERVQTSRPRRIGLLLLLLVFTLAAGVLAAFFLVQREGKRVDRIARVTVTERGTTLLQTVTEQASPPPQTSPPATTPLAATTSRATGSTLALQGYRRMQAGDYRGAIPLLEQAANDLEGSASLAEAYNDYNLAFALTKTEGCSTRVLQLLDESQAIQGARKPIDDLGKACKKSR